MDKPTSYVPTHCWVHGPCPGSSKCPWVDQGTEQQSGLGANRRTVVITCNSVEYRWWNPAEGAWAEENCRDGLKVAKMANSLGYPQRVKVEEDEAAGLQCAQWTKTLVHKDKYSCPLWPINVDSINLTILPKKAETRPPTNSRWRASI